MAGILTLRYGRADALAEPAPAYAAIDRVLAHDSAVPAAFHQIVVGQNFAIGAHERDQNPHDLGLKCLLPAVADHLAPCRALPNRAEGKVRLMREIDARKVFRPCEALIHGKIAASSAFRRQIIGFKSFRTSAERGNLGTAGPVGQACVQCHEGWRKVRHVRKTCTKDSTLTQPAEVLTKRVGCQRKRASRQHPGEIQ